MIDSDWLKETIAANVRRIRTDRELTQQQLADRAGISFVTLSRIENGHILPGANILFTLADALGVSADRLRQVSEKILKQPA